MHKEKIGLLGFGTVGSGVYHILKKNHTITEQKAHVLLEVATALVRNPEEMAQQYSDVSFTNQIEEIVEDPTITIVVEVLGGVDFAYDCVKRALESKKHVVTANKDLIAKHGVALSQLAAQNDVYLYYEASVGGGIPILRPLVEHIASNSVSSIYGIVNGTTNFMLTAMTEKEWSYEEALKIAQEKGFAEADPTSDVEGDDAVRKLIILTRLAFGENVAFESVPKKGITHITKDSIIAADKAGYVLKLLASAVTVDDKVYLEVAPFAVPKNHLLAQVVYENNAISVTGDALGEVIFYGKGAGSLPTATSVVSDIIRIAQQQDRHATVVPFEPLSHSLKSHTDIPPIRKYFVAFGDESQVVGPMTLEAVDQLEAGLYNVISKYTPQTFPILEVK